MAARYHRATAARLRRSRSSAKRRIAPRAAGVVWPPDAKRLLVVLNEETNPPGIYGPVIYVVDPDGSDLTRLFADGELPAWEQVFEDMP